MGRNRVVAEQRERRRRAPAEQRRVGEDRSARNPAVLSPAVLGLPVLSPAAWGLAVRRAVERPDPAG